MKKYQIKLILSLLLISSPLLALAQTEADPNFNPGNIITDADLTDNNSMTLAEISSFLKSKGGFISNYYTTNAHGTENKSAAEIIYDAANGTYDCDDKTLNRTLSEAEKAVRCRKVSTVNPKLLIVLLQKEMSLIEDQSVTQNQLDWAVGYGCFDSLACNPYYKSFGKQVNSAALQFRDYYDNMQSYKYKAGYTYTFTNTGNSTSQVTLENRATAALYNYTPHVFNGNYNFWKIWQRYFPTLVKHYPEGSLLKSTESPIIWLIQGNKKRPFDNWSSLASRFDTSKILTVPQSSIDAYSPGDIIKFPNYSIIKTEDKKIYLLVGNQKRLIPDDKTFKAIGFSRDEIIAGTKAELAEYATGTPLSVTTKVATLSGTLMQDKKSGEVFYVVENTKAIVDKTMLNTKFKGYKITKTTATILKKYKTTDPVLFDNGELIKSEASLSVYVVENKTKRPFASEAVLASLGYDIKKLIIVSPQHLYLYDNGETVK